MARGLVVRIFDELLAMGALKAGDTVIDPFGGIGSTALEASSRGVQAICLELESRFCILARKNLELHAKGWCTCGESGAAYLRWLRQSVPDASEPRREQDQARDDALVLQQGMLAIEPERNTPRVSESALEGRAIDPAGRLHRNQGGRPEETRACRCDGEAPAQENDAGRSGASQRRGSNEQSAYQSNSDDDFGTHAASSSERDTTDTETAALSDVPAALHVQELRDGVRPGVSSKASTRVRRKAQTEGRAGQARDADVPDLSARVHWPTEEDGGRADLLKAMLRRLPDGVQPGSTCKVCGLRIIPYSFVLQGDSRQLRQHVGPARFTGAFRGSYGRAEGQLGAMPSGHVDAVISSPPYAEIASGAGGLNTKPGKDGQQGGRNPSAASQDTDQRYGESAGQLARLPAGDVDAIICSPPYATGDSASAQSISTRTDKSAAWVKANCGSAATEGYGLTPGQLGVMPSGDVSAIVSSPPYLTEQMGGGGAKREDKVLRAMMDGYGKSDGQLGQMPAGDLADAVVSSPPFGDVEPFKDKSFRPNQSEQYQKGAYETRGFLDPDYERKALNERSLSSFREPTETFWAAAKLIVAESYAILKPGGYAVWVVKRFCRKGKVVDFPADWRNLCEYVGFTTVQEVHASLVHREEREGLFGPTVKVTARKSFFRRLYEAKRPDNAIDFETVFFMVKRAPDATPT